MPTGDKQKKLWENPEYRAKMVATHKGRMPKFIPDNKGRKRTPEQKAMYSQVFRQNYIDGVRAKGEKHRLWKGDDAGYGPKHFWVYRNLGHAKDYFCVDCGSRENLQWSNKDHEYKRIPEDWQVLCAKCHYKYDKILRTWKKRNA